MKEIINTKQESSAQTADINKKGGGGSENQKAKARDKKPTVETDSYRIWAGKHISAKKRKKIEGMTLCVNDGERVHNIVVMELVEGHTLKVLSKVRDKDQKINVLVKFEKPTDRCSVIKVDKWVPEEEYRQLLEALKKGLGAINIMTTSGEEVHAGIAYSFSTKERADQLNVLKKKKGDKDVDS